MLVWNQCHNWLKIIIKKNNTSYTEKYQNHILCIFAYKAVCIDID